VNAPAVIVIGQPLHLHLLNHLALPDIAVFSVVQSPFQLIVLPLQGVTNVQAAVLCPVVTPQDSFLRAFLLAGATATACSAPPAPVCAAAAAPPAAAAALLPAAAALPFILAVAAARAAASGIVAPATFPSHLLNTSAALFVPLHPHRQQSPTVHPHLLMKAVSSVALVAPVSAVVFPTLPQLPPTPTWCSCPQAIFPSSAVQALGRITSHLPPVRKRKQNRLSMGPLAALQQAVVVVQLVVVVAAAVAAAVAVAQVQLLQLQQQLQPLLQRQQQQQLQQLPPLHPAQAATVQKRFGWIQTEFPVRS